MKIRGSSEPTRRCQLQLRLQLRPRIQHGCSCGSGPGSFGYYDLDAQTFADWHVSYLKVDFCGTHPSPGVPSFADWMDPVQQLRRWQELRDALNRTGRPIYYSICPHALAPDSGTAAAWHNQSFAPCSDTGVVYSPPAICKRPSPSLGGVAMQELSA